MQVSTTIQNWMPRNTITFSMRLETNVNLGKKESKIRSTPNSENKIKIGVRSVHHPHPHPPLLDSLEHLVEVLYLVAQAYFITIQYITALQHYHRIFSYILEQLYHYLKCCYTVILQYFETVYFTLPIRPPPPHPPLSGSFNKSFKMLSTLW